MKKGGWLIFTIALAFAGVLACGDSTTQQPEATEPVSVVEPTSAPTVEPTQEPTATPAPDRPTVTPVPLIYPTFTPVPSDSPSSSAIMEKLRPSMVRIRINDQDYGSGFVVEGGYVVTAAHVAWPYAAAGIVFEEGTEHANVPVIGYDHHADIAFLGPISTSAPHVELANVHDEGEGSPVFALGYPVDAKELSATAGEFEGAWDWTSADVMTVGSTAAGSRGMSGGLMTNRDGEVIGVLIRGGDSGTIGASSNTLRDRLAKIERGEKASAAGLRLLPYHEGRNEHEFVLQGRWDTETFVFRSDGRTPVTIEFDSYEDVEYGLFNEFGTSDFRVWHGGTRIVPEYQSTRRSTGADRLFYPFYPYGTWFVVVRQPFDINREGVIKSTIPLARFHDADDGGELQMGDTVAGVFTPGDVDRYTIDLKEGRKVQIRIDANAIMQVTVDYPTAPPYDIVWFEGRVGELEYSAPIDAEYMIVVQSPAHVGGYTLTVSDLSGSTEVVRPERPGNVIQSPAGDMLRHTFKHSTPTVQLDYPANITGGNHPGVIGAELFEQGRRGETVALEEADLTYYKQSADEVLSFGEYIERSVLFKNLPFSDEVVTGRREIETPTGKPLLIEEFDADDDLRGVRLLYLHEEQTGFMAVYYAPSQVFEDWKPVVDYSIGTFSIGTFSVAEGVSNP